VAPLAVTGGFGCRVPAVHPACGRQDGNGQQYSQGSGGRIGNQVGATEAGRGRLRGRRDADKQCCPACPAVTSPASARRPRGQRGRGQPGGDQPGGRCRVPGRRHDEAAPGQVQGCRDEQHHHDQAPNDLGSRGRRGLPAIGIGGRGIPGQAVVQSGRRDRVVLFELLAHGIERVVQS